MSSKSANNKGQGLVEAVLTIPLMALVMTSLLLLCYRSVLYYYADHHLHEALLCCDEQVPTSCKNKLFKLIEKILLNKNQTEKNEVRQIQITLLKSYSKLSGHLLIRFPYLPEPFNVDLKIDKTIQLPLIKKPMRH